jgi:hypothetical protein
MFFGSNLKQQTTISSSNSQGRVLSAEQRRRNIHVSYALVSGVSRFSVGAKPGHTRRVPSYPTLCRQNTTGMVAQPGTYADRRPGIADEVPSRPLFYNDTISTAGQTRNEAGPEPVSSSHVPTHPMRLKGIILRCLRQGPCDTSSSTSYLPVVQLGHPHHDMECGREASKGWRHSRPCYDSHAPLPLSLSLTFNTPCGRGWSLQALDLLTGLKGRADNSDLLMKEYQGGFEPGPMCPTSH